MEKLIFALYVGGRLSVRYHDYLLAGTSLLGQQFPGYVQAVLHIGIDVKLVPSDIRQVFLGNGFLFIPQLLIIIF